MPANQLLRPLLKNSALMALSGVAGALVVVLSVPIIIARLGPDGYGVWECLLAVSSTAMIFQTAINGTLLWGMSVSCGADDKHESRRLVRLGTGVTLLLVVLCVPSLWVFRNSIVAGLSVPEQWIGEARWLLPQIVMVMLLGGVNQALLALIAGYQRAGLAALIQALGLIVTNGTIIGILLSGGGLNALLSGMLAGFGVTLLASYAVATSICGRIALWPAWPSPHEFTVLMPFAGLLLLSNLTLLLRDHADKLILASMGTVTEAGYFAIAQRFSLLIMQVGGTVCLPLTAAVGSLYAVQNWASIRELYTQVSTWLAAGVGLLAFFVCTMREPLFVLWLGEDHPQSHVYLVLLLLGVTSGLVFTGAGVALAKGIGRPGLETAYAVITLIFILITKPTLVAICGVEGCVLSSALSWCLGAICFVLILHSRINLPREILARSSGIFLVTIVLTTIAWKVTSNFSFSTTGRLEAALQLLIVGLPLAITYVALLSLFRLIPSPTSMLASLRGGSEIVVKEATA